MGKRRVDRLVGRWRRRIRRKWAVIEELALSVAGILGAAVVSGRVLEWLSRRRRDGPTR